VRLYLIQNYIEFKSQTPQRLRVRRIDYGISVGVAAPRVWEENDPAAVREMSNNRGKGFIRAVIPEIQTGYHSHGQ